MLSKIKNHKLVVLMFTLLAAAGIAFAVNELSGQANKSCADAGITGLDTEMASLDTIKQSTANPVDWNQERKLRKAMDNITADYNKLVEKAKSEIDASGAVSDATRSSGLASAQKFSDAAETYAKFWEKNNGRTRARIARETAQARIKNADMTFNTIDSDKISAYNDQLESLAQARKEYLAEAKTDVSDSDRASIKSDLQPRLTKMAQQAQSLVTNITSLLDQVKSQVTGGGIGGLVSCASSAATSDNPSAALLSPVTSLLSMAQSLVSNISDMSSEIADL